MQIKERQEQQPIISCCGAQAEVETAAAFQLFFQLLFIQYLPLEDDRASVDETWEYIEVFVSRESTILNWSEASIN